MMKLLHHDYGYYNEDMPPVLDSAFAKSDEVYKQFKRGLTAIGQAMTKKPYFGNLPLPENLNKYGAFWSDSHIQQVSEWVLFVNMRLLLDGLSR
jgi:NAD-dependent DNA ligase (contains BRCT domain type II)